MSIDIIIGGQRGDEGKGLFCQYLGLNGDYSLSVRSASPQAGHSIYIDGKRVGLVHMPCAAVNPNLRILIGGGSFIDTRKLLYGGQDFRPHTGETITIIPEIPTLGLTPERLGIDFRAKLVTQNHIDGERANPRLMKLGSIGSGVNMAKHDLVDKEAVFMTSDSNLLPYKTDTIKEMYDALEKGKHILFETDHGIDLCQHFGFFPYTTARTINTSAYLGEIGMSLRYVRDVHLIIKPYITAVAKKAPMANEITNKKVLEELIRHGGETGSVSGRPRRAAQFDSERFIHNIRMSGASKIDISHLDLSERTWDFCGFKNQSDFLNRIANDCKKTYENPKLYLGSYGPELKDVKLI